MKIFHMNVFAYNKGCAELAARLASEKLGLTIRAVSDEGNGTVYGFVCEGSTRTRKQDLTDAAVFLRGAVAMYNALSAGQETEQEPPRNGSEPVPDAVLNPYPTR